MKLELPHVAPTARRAVSVLVTLAESKTLDRFGFYVDHISSPAHVWEPDLVSLFCGSPTPNLVSEVETAVTTVLENHIIHRWGIQAVLL